MLEQVSPRQQKVPGFPQDAPTPPQQTFCLPKSAGAVRHTCLVCLEQQSLLDLHWLPSGFGFQR